MSSAAPEPTSLWNRIRAWISPGLLTQFTAILTTIIAAMTIFWMQNALMEKYSEIKLARELKAEYFSNAENIDIQRTIQACSPIYYKGQYDYVQVNKYLNFFDDIGFYYEEGLIRKSVISQYFGSLIAVVAENKEIKQYISEYREKNSDVNAFKNFSLLKEMVETDPRMHKLLQTVNEKCVTAGALGTGIERISPASNSSMR